jgi:hypothetical protein
VSSVVSLVESELRRAQVPPSSTVYQEALADARALDAEREAADAAVQKKLDAILAQLRRQARPPAHCASASASSAPRSPPTTTAAPTAALTPLAPTPDAGAPPDAGR